MKKYSIIKTIEFFIILFGVFANPSYAFVGHPSMKEIDTPIQSNLIYNASEALINPFEMTSFSIGKLHASYPHEFKNAFKKGIFDNMKGRGYELKLEVPFYQEKTSFGLDCILFNSESTENDSDSQFLSLVAVDALATFKLKLPFHTSIGPFALTVTPKAGLIYILLGLGPQEAYVRNLGFSVGVSTGIDYYFSQWWGVFIEHSIKHNRVNLFTKESTPQTAYTYYTNAITFGIKTTF